MAKINKNLKVEQLSVDEVDTNLDHKNIDTNLLYKELIDKLDQISILLKEISKNTFKGF